MAERSKNTGGTRNGSRSASRASNNRGSSAGSRKGSTPSRASRKAPAKAVERRPILDARAKRDLAGVAISVTGVAMMIAVTTDRTGVAAEWIASALRSLVGLGAYVVPIVLVLWGISFFVRVGDISEARIGAGLAMIVVALTGMVALATPEADFFGPELSNYGGYVGASIAWVLHTLVGTTIGYVLLVGMLIGGFIVIGLSISKAVEIALDRWFPGRDETAAAPRAERARPARVTPGADDVTQRTLPLPLDETDEASATPASSGRRRSGAAAGDPEAMRKTTPVAAVNPRRMEGFELPSAELLLRTMENASMQRATDSELGHVAQVIAGTLSTFGIPTYVTKLDDRKFTKGEQEQMSRVVDWIAGPTVTLFRLEIARGIRVNTIGSLADDLALALASSQIRVLAPIPDTSLVGIEVPNVRRRDVTLGDVMPPAGAGGPLMLAVGKDVSGKAVVPDLAKMPHLLIGGTTGSGKSVAINSILMSILMRTTPSEVRLILIDPKRVELTLFNGVPHLYVPVVVEPKEAASALAWAVSEMERRLRVLSSAGVRNVSGYNELVQKGKLGEEATELPYLVIVIDELADLMMVAAKEVEDSICRIAQLARAAGIHLIVATQRPEANVVTGLIKANITNRMAFQVASSIDSRVILDGPGAEKLVGRGDMLFAMPSEWSKPKRVQGCFVSEDEINTVVDHLKNQGEPEYHEEILHLKVSSVGGGIDDGDDDDPLLWEAADVVVTSGLGSTSMLQRRLKVGYARAGRIMDILESKGVVGPPSGSKPREVLVDIEELESIKAFERHDREEAM